ncbi:RNA polymerase sigma factor [Amycolatopsis sp. YIM 10]|nr:RNA polymerase sigma factor [Amycolatopsis sp. YIM 10]QFU92703.1 RNA polymerase sigma factor [Amycolatopsis sp. YIM 10]
MTEPAADGPAVSDVSDVSDTDRPDLGGADVVRTFGLLYDRHARGLHRYLARRAGAVADDLVAETFLVALQTRHNYVSDRGTARSWLYGIATNLLRGHLREQTRTLRLAARMAGEARQNAEPPDARVPDSVDAEEQVGRLSGALARIEPGNRDAAQHLGGNGRERGRRGPGHSGRHRPIPPPPRAAAAARRTGQKGLKR